MYHDTLNGPYGIPLHATRDIARYIPQCICLWVNNTHNNNVTCKLTKIAVLAANDIFASLYRCCEILCLFFT